MPLRLRLTVVITFFSIIHCFGQDPEFSQFYSNPLYYNPAFTGVKVGPRIILNFRDQWPSLNAAFVSYSASYDQFIEKIRSGIGVNVVEDDAGGGIYHSFSADLMYSYQIQVSDNFNINIALDGGYFQRSLDWGSTVFADQLNPLTPYNVGATSEPEPLVTKATGADFGAGFLAYSQHFYFGAGVNHLFTPNEGFLNNDPTALIPRRISANLGWEVSSKRDISHNTFFSPNLIFLQQDGQNQLNAGAYFGITPLYIGFYYREAFTNPDAVILLVGFTQGIFKIGYSYDITVSGLAGNTGGAHELSLIINFADRNSETKDTRNAYKEIAKCPIIF